MTKVLDMKSPLESTVGKWNMEHNTTKEEKICLPLPEVVRKDELMTITKWL